MMMVMVMIVMYMTMVILMFKYAISSTSIYLNSWTQLSDALAIMVLGLATAGN